MCKYNDRSPGSVGTTPYSAAQLIRNRMIASFGNGRSMHTILPSDVAIFIQEHWEDIAPAAHVLHNAPRAVIYKWQPPYLLYPEAMPDYAVSG